MDSLTENAVLHISAGFDGPFTLQIFGLRKHPDFSSFADMCLTDGNVYIGAFYDGPDANELKNYALVRITAKFEDRFHPIIIRSLDIVGHATQLLGNPPCTLQDCLNRQIQRNETAELRKKKIKLNEQIECKSSRSWQTVREKPVNFKSQTMNRPKISSQTLTTKNPLLMQPTSSTKKNDKRELKFASESENEKESPPILENPTHEEPTFMPVKTEKPPEPSPTQKISKQKQKSKQLIAKDRIDDLWQRKQGWSILCRVNYLSVVSCSNGICTFAVNFIIVDQTGSQIKCVYFQSDKDIANSILAIHNYYLFAKGEIKSNKDILEITFDRSSEILPMPNMHFQLPPQRIKRVNELTCMQSGAFVTVIGIIRKIKSKHPHSTKIKYTATLCDPLKDSQVDFVLFLRPQQRSIQKGMVVQLHNYQIHRQHDNLRLNSNYKSYFFQQQQSQRSNLTRELHLIVQKTAWDCEIYRNISSFSFTQRTFSQLRQIMNYTNDDKSYSVVDCWIMEISKKKFYYACRSCKKITEKREMNLYECVNCKKLGQGILTYTLSTLMCDYTASCYIDVIGDQAEKLIEKKAVEFHAMDPVQQNAHLDKLKYKNVLMKLRTERKPGKGDSHSVYGIEKSTADNTLREIRKKNAQNRLKLEEDQWM